NHPSPSLHSPLSLHDALPIWGRHVLGVGAVRRHSDVAGRCRAQCLPTAPAEPADAAGEIEVAGHAVADTDVSDLGTDLDDLARRSEEHTSELQSRSDLVCRLL